MIPTPVMTVPIIPSPREAVQRPQETGVHPHREFGVPLRTHPSPIGINAGAVKDLNLRRPVPPAGAKFDRPGSSGLVFSNSNPHPTLSKFGSSESPTLFKPSHTVLNSTVSPTTPFLATTATHSISPTITTMDGSVYRSVFPTDSSASVNFVSDSDLAMKQLWDECVVSDFDEDPSFLFTPPNTTTPFVFSTLTAGHDTPTINLAEIDSYLSSTSIGNQDFSLFGDSIGLNTDDWNQKPLFNPGAIAEDLIAPYALFKDTTATVTSGPPNQFSTSSPIDAKAPIKQEPPLSPALSPETARKPATRRRTAEKPAAATRKVSTSTAPYTPITPAPTNPSTPQPVLTRATKRRIPVWEDDPTVIEKRRRNTIAAQRSRARKAEERADDKSQIEKLEKERDTLKLILAYWKDRACALGASPLEDGEN